MKKIVLFTPIILSALFSQSQVYTSSCVPSGDMQAVYRNDAYRLATKRVYDINSPWKDSVMIPQVFIDSIEKALYAIENMHYSSIKDTIMLKFGYHNFIISGVALPGDDSSHIHAAGNFNYAYRLKRLMIKIVSNPTPEALDSINNLVTKYDLTVAPQTLSTELISAQALNIPALVKQFQMISGIQYSEKEGYIGSGNDISAEFINGDIILTYFVGCGDCPSGCTFGRAWKFKVNTSTDCSVQYLSAYNTGMATIMSLDDLGFSDCIGVVVAIELTNIKATQKNNYQLIEWQMATEDNVANYVIERSPDAFNYTAIGQVNAKHNASTDIHYSWIDNDAISGKTFYRIKIVERSGVKTYSPVAMLDVKLKPGIIIFPTLVEGNAVNVRFNKVEKGTYAVSLLNTAGQKLFSTQVDINTEAYNKEIPMPSTITAGTYILSVKGNGTQLNQLIVIPRK